MGVGVLSVSRGLGQKYIRLWEGECFTPCHSSPMHAAKRQYPITKEPEKAVEEIVHKLFEWGIVRPVQCPSNSPVWPVKKPQGSWRLTIDYTGLNAVTEKQHPIVANPATILNYFGGGYKYFTAC